MPVLMTVAARKVNAVSDYESDISGGFSFPEGQGITIICEVDNDRYVGDCVDAAGVQVTGIFPKSSVGAHQPRIPDNEAKINVSI